VAPKQFLADSFFKTKTAFSLILIKLGYLWIEFFYVANEIRLTFYNIISLKFWKFSISVRKFAEMCFQTTFTNKYGSRSLYSLKIT